jgi:hypothetical protein
LQTFLLDKEDKIILVGNPLFSEKLKEMYKNEVFKNDYPQNTADNSLLIQW